MYNDEAIKEQMAGTTAVSILIKDGKLYCANAGDSRAIGSRNGSLVTLSNDHKPNNPEEMERIYNAGGWVEFNRVNGNLALSRALGDFLFKRNQTVPAEQQIVTGEIISNCNQRERASRRFSPSNSHKKTFTFCSATNQKLFLLLPNSIIVFSDNETYLQKKSLLIVNEKEENNFNYLNVCAKLAARISGNCMKTISKLISELSLCFHFKNKNHGELFYEW